MTKYLPLENHLNHNVVHSGNSFSLKMFIQKTQAESLTKACQSLSVCPGMWTHLPWLQVQNQQWSTTKE